MHLPWLEPGAAPTFPPPESALLDPPGLLAAGGDLSIQRLVAAYRQGIFPWYEDGQPILWWCPEPRAVLFPERLRISRSLRKRIRSRCYEVSFDRAFEEVIAGCAAPRGDSRGTWITEEMASAYQALHRAGFAHSVEVWSGGQLVGGLYGVAIGRVYFGESMFSRATDASKVGFATLVRHLRAWGYTLIDCQIPNPHLASLGAETVPRSHFLRHLERDTARAGHPNPWRVDPALDASEPPTGPTAPD
jgi:leucyl/phenylalanyl-tRNA--protein transferase